MCVSYPVRVLAVEPDGTAVVDRHGRSQRVVLLDTQASAGDWLLVHSGIALGRIDAAEARLRQELVDRATGGGR